MGEAATWKRSSESEGDVPPLGLLRQILRRTQTGLLKAMSIDVTSTNAHYADAKEALPNAHRSTTSLSVSQCRRSAPVISTCAPTLRFSARTGRTHLRKFAS